MSRPRAAPRSAATVLLARDGADDLELFMLRRPAGAIAFANAWVFPGGTVRADDELPPDAALSDRLLDEMTRRGGVPPKSATGALALWRAALRELAEETGLLLARGGASGDPALELELETRERIRRGELSLISAAMTLGRQPDLDALVYFSHWITPEDRRQRFDTRFFVAALPVGRAAAHCAIETTDGAWIAPRRALGEYAAGRFQLVLPTRLHLQRLTPIRTVAELIALARQKPIRTVVPGRPSDDDDPRYWGPLGEERSW